MAEIRLENLNIEFGAFKAVQDVNLTVKNGEFVVYLGPSGCGKTTTLRSIAGLVAATSGDIRFDGQRVNDLSASERNIAMVFQFVSLYPHLKIRQNIAFPLKARGVAKAEIARKLDWVTEIFKLGDDLDRYPGALPPGVRQKVALARAVIRDPAVLLLDEPLSAIDEQFREEMRWELGHLQRQLGVTTIYVTHDQREAMSLADRIVLMSDGRIVQVAEPDAMFLEPVSVFAGQFIGSPSMNLIDLEPNGGGLKLGRNGAVTLIPEKDGIPPWVLKSQRPLKLGIRPLNIHLVDSRRQGDGVALPVDDVYSVGRERFFTFRIGDALCQGVDKRDAKASGTAGQVHFSPEGFLFFDAETGRRVTGEATL
ncbi:ABC transporter ATP-binding protein [Agrobacterium sp. 22-214-1]